MATSRPSAPKPMVPRVNPRKWTTQVNIAIVISVVVIMVVGSVIAWVVWHRHRHHDDAATNAATSLRVPPRLSSA